MAPVTMPSPVISEQALSEPDALYEVVDGERREVSPMGVFAGSLASRLGARLNHHAEDHGSGLAVVENLFKLTADARQKRRPDVAFFSFDKLKSQPNLDQDPEFWDFAPDLAVEANSRSNTGDELLDKIEEYFQAGVQLVWVIYPRQRRFYVYDTPTSVRVLTDSDELDGGKVIPGFRLALASLFAVLVPHA